MAKDISGPIIRWDDYGVEGWVPRSYPTIEAALTKDLHGNDYVITRVAEYNIVETTAG